MKTVLISDMGQGFCYGLVSVIMSSLGSDRVVDMVVAIVGFLS